MKFNSKIKINKILTNQILESHNLKLTKKPDKAMELFLR
jgi:hypothetical protein